MKAIIGIDPGKSGASCLLTEALTFEFFDWPKDNDLYSVFMQLKTWRRDYHIVGAILEDVHAIHGTAARSTFAFGANTGYWEMGLTAAMIGYFKPPPQTWQKGLVKKSDGDSTKERAYKVASRLFPAAELKGPRGGHLDGRSDALLMAWFGMKYYNLNSNPVRTRVK